MSTNLPAKLVEEWFIEAVLQIVGDLVHPNETLTRLQIDEAEPKVLLESRTWSDAQPSIGMKCKAIAAENKEATETGLRPARRSSAERRMIYTG